MKNSVKMLILAGIIALNMVPELFARRRGAEVIVEDGDVVVEEGENSETNGNLVGHSGRPARYVEGPGFACAAAPMCPKVHCQAILESDSPGCEPRAHRRRRESRADYHDVNETQYASAYPAYPQINPQAQIAAPALEAVPAVGQEQAPGGPIISISVPAPSAAVAPSYWAASYALPEDEAIYTTPLLKMALDEMLQDKAEL